MGERAAMSARWTDPPRQPGGRGPNGRPFCRICREEVPRGRRTFCSQGCVDRLFIMMGDVRGLAFQRDRGVCAWCETDTERIKGLLDACWADDLALYESLRARWHLGFSTFGNAEAGHLWEADHIVPWSEGGRDLGLENIRTLCRACHKERTAAWHRDRAARRTAQPDLIAP